MQFWDKNVIHKIRKGYYSAVYFNRTKQILQSKSNESIVTMQIFQKQDNRILCGINQVIELLKLSTGYFEKGKWISKTHELSIHALSDGDTIQKGETVMHITGPYIYFAHLESIYLGILARQTRIATNASEIVKAANKKQVLFFADRFDYFLSQEADGYASRTGGVSNVCTQAQGMWINQKPVGTIPHALIAIHHGNTLQAVRSYQKQFPKTPLVALVDFDNDCVKTSLDVATMFGNTLWGIRLDTSENMVDESLKHLTEKHKEYHGVNPTLVKLVRTSLDMKGYTGVKIIVSGGFNKEKIILFEKEKTPVDVYAVGSAMFDGKNDFTADIVKVSGKLTAKVGRKFQTNNRLKEVSIS